MRQIILTCAIVFAVGVLGFNAEAIENTIISPDSISCNDSHFIKEYDSISGKFVCEPIVITNNTTHPTPDSTQNTSDLTESELESLRILLSKLSIYDDESHTYIESRFNGVGEGLVPSGSQFQIWCDSITNQNCTLWMTSADEKTSALVFSKYIDGQWSKVGAFSEGSDHNSVQILTYDIDDKGLLRMKFTDDRTEIQNGLRIMTKDSSTGVASELMRFYDDKRITLFSSNDRCDITVENEIVMCK